MVEQKNHRKRLTNQNIDRVSVFSKNLFLSAATEETSTLISQ